MPSFDKPSTDYVNGLCSAPVHFEWDPAKDRSNQRKHGVSFAEAQRLFESDVEYLEIFDADNSEFEDRFIAIGLIHRRIVGVVYTEPEKGRFRIIGARRANSREQDMYHSRMDRHR